MVLIVLSLSAMKTGLLIIVTFSAILRLSCDWTTVSGGNWRTGENYHPPQKPWQPQKTTSKLCHVGIHWIALLNTLRWIPVCQGFSHL